MNGMTVLGADIGYGFVKVIGERSTVCFPSVVGPAVEAVYTSELLRDSQPVAYHIGERIWFVGQAAERQSPTRLTLLDRSRVTSEQLLVLALAALHQAQPHGPVYLVTGLPVAYFADRDTLTRRLQGRHHFRAGDEHVYLEVQRMLVVPQGVGVLYSLMLNDDGQPCPTRLDLAETNVGLIDVGMCTTDFVRVRELEYIEVGSGSIPEAMSQVLTTLQRAVQERWELTLDLHEADLALRTGHVRVFGDPHPVRHLVEPAVAMLAERVTAEARQLWGDGRKLDRVLLAGGGGAWLKPTLQAAFPHIELVTDGALANARGFYRYGRLRADAEG